MTIHKFNPEPAVHEAQPLDVALNISNRMYYFTDAVVRARALRAISVSATNFPVYRLIRHSAREKLQNLFDDIAMKSGLHAHRLEEGELLLDGPGVFVSAWGRWKATYSSFIAHVWAETPERLEEMRATIARILGDRDIRDEMFVINWQFSNGDGGLNAATFEEICDAPLLDEAYPSLGEPVTAFARRYLAAPETVLVLQGPPGTGKTRLVRAIFAEMSRRKGEKAKVMYTADKRLLEKDEIFVEFITGSHDFFVVEDADHLLKARSSGNVHLHRFLAVADGVVRAQGRKIIFTTNLPNIGDIDDALLRPGRCFASANIRPLNREEARRLTARLCDGDDARSAAALEKAFPEGARSTSLASIFRACNDSEVARVADRH